MIGVIISSIYKPYALNGKNPNRYKVTKRIYKTDKVTMNYWGYFYDSVPNLDIGKLVSSKTYFIASLQ